MLKLLKGSFIRLFNSSEFQIIPFLLIIANLMLIIMKKTNHSGTDAIPELPLFNVFFHVMIISICTAAFVSLFIGTEYSNATVFNKIIFGHSRTSVYLTYLLTCLFAAAFFQFLATAATTLIGWAIIGKPSFTVGTLISCYLLSLPSLFAVVSLHLTITIILQSRALSVGVSSSISTIMLFVSMFLCTDEHYMKEYLDLLPDFYLNKLAMSEEIISKGVIEKMNFPLYPCLLFIFFTFTGLLIFNNINIKNTPEGEV